MQTVPQQPGISFDTEAHRTTLVSCLGRGIKKQVRPIRICFLIDELATAGTETQLLALIRHLDRTRFQPYLCLLRGDTIVSQHLEPDDCPVLRLGVGRLFRPITLMQMGSFARFLRRERIDIVQVYFPDSSYFGVPAAWLARVPHRLRTRNNIGHWMTPLHRMFGRVLNRFATGTIANCAAAHRALLTDERPDPANVVVLENGVDLARFRVVSSRPRRLVRTTPVVGMVANLRSIKGLDVFLEAASRLNRQVVLRVAGEGELRPTLEHEAARLGLADRLELPGTVADVPEFLADLDIAVSASRAEGMSNAILEYMAAGKAIVATAVGATPELIEDGVHGLLVPPGDPGRFAAAIDCLLADPSRAQCLGEAARRRAWERYSREAMVRRFENFYQGLANTRRAS